MSVNNYRCNNSTLRIDTQRLLLVLDVLYLLVYSYNIYTIVPLQLMHECLVKLQLMSWHVLSELAMTE